MEDNIITTGASGTYRIGSGSGNLRFIERDGKKILQQAGQWTEYSEGGAVSSGIEWFDVPLVTELL